MLVAGESPRPGLKRIGVINLPGPTGGGHSLRAHQFSLDQSLGAPIVTRGSGASADFPVRFGLQKGAPNDPTDRP